MAYIQLDLVDRHTEIFCAFILKRRPIASGCQNEMQVEISTTLAGTGCTILRLNYSPDFFIELWPPPAIIPFCFNAYDVRFVGQDEVEILLATTDQAPKALAATVTRRQWKIVLRPEIL